MKIPFTIISFLSFFPGYAEMDSTKLKVGVYSHVGQLFSDFSELNSNLIQLGYPTLRDSYSSVSLGLYFRKPNRSSYSSISVTFNQTNPSSEIVVNKDVLFRNWEIQLSGHLDLIGRKGWLVYPCISEGIGYGRLILYDNVLQQQSFINSAANLSIPTTKKWSSIVLFIRPGVGVEKKIRFWVYDLHVGFTGGYRLNFSHFTENPPSSEAPIKLNGLEWNFILRAELWKKP